MKVVGKKFLKDFCDRHADARSALYAWLAEAEDAEWKQPADIKEKHSSASFLSGKRVVFNIKGNSYRLLVKVSYKNQIVLVEKAGTHAEYSKWNL